MFKWFWSRTTLSLGAPDMWNELTIDWNDLTMERNDRIPSCTQQTTDQQIKIFVTENTGRDTFCMEEYSEKYTIVAWNSLLR